MHRNVAVALLAILAVRVALVLCALLLSGSRCTTTDVRLLIPDYEPAAVLGVRAYTEDGQLVGEARLRGNWSVNSLLWVVSEERLANGTLLWRRLIPGVPDALPGSRIFRFSDLPAGSRRCRAVTYNAIGESPRSSEAFAC